MSLRLCNEALSRLPAHVARPSYDRARLRSGIVHIGPGAFHRAHQAALVDTLLQDDPRWAITAMSLRSRETTAALRAQDGLFTLKTLGEGGQTRISGAILDAFSAPDDAERALTALGGADTRLITLTITEKGYCLDTAGQLDENHRDILNDLASPGAPRSAIGWLVAGLARRKAAGAPAPVIMSCDNLADNGIKLAAAVVRLAGLGDPALARWIEAEARFPCTMVDAITPASDGGFLDALESELGVRDDAAVKREVFTSWVIEAADCEAVEALGRAGALITPAVAGHANAKLRVLNGAHSALAWTGLALGYSSVSEAVRDRWLGPETEAMIGEEILPALGPVPGLDPHAYAHSVMARFANPAISHALSQIAWDSSQKLLVRLLGTLSDNLASGLPVTRLARAIAAWMRFVVRSQRAGTPLTDPLSDQLFATARACRDNPDHDTAAFLGMETVFTRAQAGNPVFRKEVSQGYRDIIALESGTRPSTANREYRT